MKHGLVAWLCAVLVLALGLILGCASVPAAADTKPGVDWSKVAASTDGVQIVAWKTIARHCDAWYKGAKPAVDLRFNPDGHVEDGARHRMRMSAADFNGIVQATRAPGATVEAFASLSEMYSNGREGVPQDKFGLKARYRYRVTAVSDDVLRYTVIEKLDGGM